MRPFIPKVVVPQWASHELPNESQEQVVIVVAVIRMCVVRRHHPVVGSNPAQPLSLWPVAVGAILGGNDVSHAEVFLVGGEAGGGQQ